MSEADAYDLLIVGGGVNGCGVARDAAGRGLSVLLAEKDDLASQTSSASTKLIHGGLRYLEHYEFRLVREALAEREVLLAIAPHLVRPMRFVMPLAPGARPAWMIRAGLFLYDHIGGPTRLAKSKAVRLDGPPWGAGLKDVRRGFAYSDAWVDDARLVTLNAVDAAARGATVLTRTAFLGARRQGDLWIATLQGGRKIAARAIVNTAGPWVARVLGELPGLKAERPPRLIKGSHIVTPRLYDGEHAYILQNTDRRIVFAIPYERRFTLIGTTDKAYTGELGAPRIDADEVDYLCRAVNPYLARQISPSDVMHSYSGVRPLYDDGREDASAVTRDYVLTLGAEDGPQVLSAFGGKITTYRRLAEHALDKLRPFLPQMGRAWTSTAALPGGELPGGDFEAFFAEVRRRWPFLEPDNALRLARAYGTRIERVLEGASMLEDLGGGLSPQELDYLTTYEWARTADDILWRRTKLGLTGSPHLVARVRQMLGSSPDDEG